MHEPVGEARGDRFQLVGGEFQLGGGGAEGHNHNTTSSNSAIDVILCPGDYSPAEAAVYGIETVAFLQRFRANRAFIGASGLSASGIMDANRFASAVKRIMLAQADTRYLLVDHSKFNQRKLSLVGTLSAVDAVITDRAPDGALLAALGEADVDVHAASGEESEAAA